MESKRGLSTPPLICLLLLAHTAVLIVMGRIPFCNSGFSLWIADAWGSCTSQNLFDPYSFTHIEHGIIFYWVLQRFVPHLSPSQRLFLALLIEMAWEILENSPIVIDRYRTVTASLDYYGDSILNSVGDVISCLLGFILARIIPARVSVGMLFLVEVLLLITVHDNLTLNVIMLIYPIAAVREWQMQMLAR